MSVKTKPCRDCGVETMWLRSLPSGRWHQYLPVPVPFTDQRPGAVFHRRRGWMDAGTAWPEPKAMLPRHFHPRARDEREPRVLSDVLDEWLTPVAGSKVRRPRRMRVDSAS